MKLRWRKPPLPKIDRVLGTNGAHSINQRHELVDQDNRVVARVMRTAGAWRYWLAGGAASGPFPMLDRAKEAARRAVEGGRR